MWTDRIGYEDIRDKARVVLVKSKMNKKFEIIQTEMHKYFCVEV